MDNPEQVLEYWFGDLDAGGAGNFELWFGKSEEADREIKKRFEDVLGRAGRGDLDAWGDELRSCLALIILLDQFPRNMYRDTARAFAFDETAREVCLMGIERGFDTELPTLGRLFFYLPLEHSESLELQERSVEMFKALLDDAPAPMTDPFKMVHEYAVKHHDIIKRFGRFPHRNQALGRTSTPEEVEFLEEPGSSF